VQETWGANLPCSYCLNDGYGTRRIPDGAITGAHFVKVENETVSYVQVSGVGDVSYLPWIT
jgi:hypothetical protein